MVRPSGSSASFGVTGLIGVRPGNRWVRSWSLGILRCALGTSGSFWIAVFIRVRPVGCPLRSGSLGSLGWALVVIGFVGGCCVDCGAPFGVVCFVRGNWVNGGSPWESLGSFGSVRFIGLGPGGHRVRSGSLGSLGSAIGVVGCRWVRSGSMGSLGCALLVAVFFHDR